MRLIFLIVISILFGFSTIAQSIEILDNNQNYHGNIGSKIEVPIKIKNNSDRVLHLMVQRVSSQIGSTQSTFFCWGDECFSKDTYILPTSRKLAPGEESSAFISVLEAGLTEQFSTVTYIFYDRDNPSDAISYELNYNVEEKEIKGLLFESEDITLSVLSGFFSSCGGINEAFGSVYKWINLTLYFIKIKYRVEQIP